MDPELLKQAVKQVRAEIARAGGLARAKSMTAKQRRESATKASKAAAAARKRKKTKDKKSPRLEGERWRIA